MPHHRVLIVDDEPLIGQIIASYLTKAEFNVIGPITNCADALETIANNQIDFAILDVNLYHERSDAIAADLQTRNIPFVFMTGYSTDGLSEQFNDVTTLPKPSRAATVVDAVNKGLGLVA